MNIRELLEYIYKQIVIIKERVYERIKVIVFTLIFSVKLTLREGTIIGMLIFGSLMGLFIKNIKSVFIKYRIIQ